VAQAIVARGYGERSHCSALYRTGTSHLVARPARSLNHEHHSCWCALAVRASLFCQPRALLLENNMNATPTIAQSLQQRTSRISGEERIRRTYSPPPRRRAPHRSASIGVQHLQALHPKAPAPDSHKHVEVKSVESLVSLLKAVKAKDPNVQRIVLDGGNRCLPAAYLRCLVSALTDNPCILSLKLTRVFPRNRHSLFESDYASVWADIATFVKQSKSLQCLDLSRNEMENATCVMIAEALSNCSGKITKLDLSGNRFDATGMTSLCRSFSCMKHLSSLKLGRNMLIAEVGWINLVQQLPDTILALDVRSTRNWGKNAIQFLCTRLSSPHCLLQTLVLSRNHVDWTSLAVQQLAKALRTNTHLKTLDLQRCWRVDDDAAAEVAKMLFMNHTFTKLKIRRTLVSDRAKQGLFEWLLLNSCGPVLSKQTKGAWNQLMNTTPKPMSSSTRRLRECVICYEYMHSNTAVLLPCMHHDICESCAARLEHCHMCRHGIGKVCPVSIEIADSLSYLSIRESS